MRVCGGMTLACCLHPAAPATGWLCCRRGCDLRLSRGDDLTCVLDGMAYELEEVDMLDPACGPRDLLVVTPPVGSPPCVIRRRASQAHLVLRPRRPHPSFAQGGAIPPYQPMPSTTSCGDCGADESEHHDVRCPRRAGVIPRLTPAPVCACPSLFRDGHLAGCPAKRPPRHVLG